MAKLLIYLFVTSWQRSLLQSSRKGSGLRKRIGEHYRQAYERDKQLVTSVDIHQLNRWILTSVSILGVFFFLDVTTTLFAFSTMSGFVEMNIIVSRLFEKGYTGFLWALALKYYPLLPVALVIYLNPHGTRFDLQIRVAKVGVLTGLTAANFIYVFIVSHNLALLLGMWR